MLSTCPRFWEAMHAMCVVFSRDTACYFESRWIPLIRGDKWSCVRASFVGCR